jgi:hypothetical protein
MKDLYIIVNSKYVYIFIDVTNESLCKLLSLCVWIAITIKGVKLLFAQCCLAISIYKIDVTPFEDLMCLILKPIFLLFIQFDNVNI